jgi:hypothetical protein
MSKIHRVNLREARDMADALTDVLKSYEPQNPTLAFAAVLVLAGRFMATQVELGADPETVGGDAFNLMIDECVRRASVKR